MKKPMRTVTEAKVKANLDALLDEVAQGAQIAITRRGKEVGLPPAIHGEAAGRLHDALMLKC